MNVDDKIKYLMMWSSISKEAKRMYFIHAADMDKMPKDFVDLRASLAAKMHKCLNISNYCHQRFNQTLRSI